MITVTTAQKSRHVRLALRDQTVRERRLARQLSAEIKRVARQAASKGSADGLVSEHKSNVLSLVQRNTLSTVNGAFDDAIDKLGKSGIVRIEHKYDSEDAYRARAVKAVRARALDVADVTSKTTISRIKGVIARGMDADKSPSEIADDIVARVGGAVSERRAMTIARTETHSAAQIGQHESVASTGIDFKREWIATSDESTREDHSSASGQKTSMDEPFQVGGESLMYPGDPSGSAEQIINCRCQVGYISR
jgi:uncharacterized protein with gpF-like domain